MTPFAFSYMAGRPYDPTKVRTYRDDVGYDPNSINIEDVEDVAMRDQGKAGYPVHHLWDNGTANAYDWANPGKNSKNPR